MWAEMSDATKWLSCWSCDCRSHYRNRANVPVVVLSDSDDLLMRRC